MPLSSRKMFVLCKTEEGIHLKGQMQLCSKEIEEIPGLSKAVLGVLVLGEGK